MVSSWLRPVLLLLLVVVTAAEAGDDDSGDKHTTPQVTTGLAGDDDSGDKHTTLPVTTSLAVGDAETTKAVADAETTTVGVATASDSSPMSVLTGIEHAFMKQLKHGYQWANSLLAFVIGVLMVAQGEPCFEGLLIVAGALCGYVLTISELEFIMGKEALILQKFVAAEIAVVVAVAFYQGIRGAKFLAGALVGVLLTCGLYHVGSHLDWARHWLCTPIGIVVMLNIFGIMGLTAIVSKMHVKVLAVVCPLLGGWLVAGSSLFFMTEALYLVARMKPEYKERLVSLDFQPHRPELWMQFMAMLLHPAGNLRDDDGPFIGFGGSSKGEREDMIDRGIGWFIWFTCFVLGTWLQLRKMAQLKEEKKGDLEQPLLGSNDVA